MTDAREQFGRSAELYLTSPTHSDAGELAEYVEWIKPSGGAVLDIATGAGHTAFAFVPYASRVVALDITPEMLAVTAREATARGFTNLETHLGPAEKLDFADGEFEGVTCRTAPHHFHDVAAFLSESYRVTQPGGWLLLVDTVGVEDDKEADDQLQVLESVRDPSHVRDYTVAWWRDAVDAAGYGEIEIKERSRDHDAHLWLERMHVSPEDRTRLIAMMIESTGAFRNYLNPQGKGDSLRFDLRYMALVARKPHA